MLRRTIAWVALFAICIGTLVAQSTPETVNLQGRLTDASGNAINSTVDMRFHLYDASSGGTLLLSDYHEAGATGGVVVTDGHYNVALGSGNLVSGTVNTMAQVFGTTTTVYVLIEIDGGGGFESLSPRTPLLAVGHAINSDLLDGQDGSYYKQNLSDVVGQGASAGGTTISDLGAPASANDAATKTYVDSANTTQDSTHTAHAGNAAAHHALTLAASAQDVSTTEAELDQALDGISANVTAANLSVLTGGTTTALHSHAAGVATDSDTLDLLDSTEFLRSNAADSFTSGTLTINAGATLRIDGTLNISGTNVNASATDLNLLSGRSGTTIWGADNDGSGSTLDADLLDGMSSAEFLAGVGRSGGQTLTGGTGANEDLTLESTSSGTKGDILLNVTSGNVGIGTNAPAQTLEVAGNTLTTLVYTQGVELDIPSSSFPMFIAKASGSDDTLTIQADDVESAFISASTSLDGGNTSGGDLTIHSTSHATKGDIFLNPTSGNVGIGTTSPSEALEVAGNVLATLVETTSLTIDAPGSSGATLFINKAGGSDDTLVIEGDTVEGVTVFATGTLYGGTGAGDDLVLDSTSNGTKGDILLNATSGNVGIGTNAPSEALEVSGNILATLVETTSLTIDAPGGVGQTLFVTKAGGSDDTLTFDGDTLQVTNTVINGVTYAWPGTQGGAGEVLTNNGSGTLSWSAPGGGGGDANTLDTLDSLQFLRSDASDSFTSGTLTTDVGTTFNVAGALQIGGVAMTTSAADLNQISGIGANVTAANLDALTGGGSTGLHSHAAGNADTLDTLDSLDFLRTSASSNVATGNTLTTDSGSTFNVAGTFQISGVAMTTSATDLNQISGIGVNVTAANLDTLTGGGSTALHSHAAADADTLDTLDSTAFLRADASDNFTTGVLTTDAGTIFNVAGTFQIGGVGMTTSAADLNQISGIGVNVTAANLDTLTGGGSTALHSHSLSAAGGWTDGGASIALTTNTDTVAIESSLRLGSAGAPSDTLDVDGTGHFSGNLTTATDLEVQGADIRNTTGALNLIPAAGNSLSVTVSGAGDFMINSTAFVFDSSALSVGIGTNAPVSRLHVLNATPVTNSIITSATIEANSTGTPAVGFGTGLLFRSEDSLGNVENAVRISGVMANVTNGSEASAIVLETRVGGGALSEKVRIDGTGNVGIGISNPTALLQVGSGGTLDNVGANDVYIQNDLEVDGTIYGTVAGGVNPGLTTGSVAFQGAGGLSQDNSNFFWDNTNKWLGVGTGGSPQTALHGVKLDGLNSSVSTVLLLDHDGGSAGANGIGTAIEFRANDASNSLDTIGIIKAEFDTTTNGSEDGALSFNVMDAGSLSEFLRVDNGGVHAIDMLHVDVASGSNNAIDNAFDLIHDEGGVGAVGIGVGMSFNANDDSGAVEWIGSIEGSFDAVANGTELGALSFVVNSGGTGFEIARMDSSAGLIATGLGSEKQTGINNSIYNVFGISHVTSGTAVAGMGVGMEFLSEDGSGNTDVIARMGAEFTNVTNGSETGDLVFDTISGGTIAEQMRLTGGGVLSVGSDIESGNQFLGIDGSNAVPSYSFTNDTNTGLTTGGIADRLYIATGGTYRGYFDSTGLRVEGGLTLKEGGPPGGTAGYGKIFVSSGESLPKFVDDSGTIHDLVTMPSSFVNRQIGGFTAYQLSANTIDDHGLWNGMTWVAGGGDTTVAGSSGLAFQLSSQTTTNDVAKFYSNSVHRRQWDSRMFVKFRMNTNANQRFFIGFADSGSPQILGNDAPAGGEYIGLQVSTNRGDTNFQFITDSGASQAIQDSGVAVDTSEHFLLVELDSTGNGTIELYDASGSFQASHTFSTSLPANGTALQFIAGMETLNITSKSFQVFYGWGDNPN